jgi:hypothetical protein
LSAGAWLASLLGEASRMPASPSREDRTADAAPVRQRMQIASRARAAAGMEIYSYARE